MAITTEYTYDSVGNVQTAKDPRGMITKNEYYNSRLLKKTIADQRVGKLNITTEYEYYDDGRLKDVKQNTTEDGWIYHQFLTYTARGQTRTVKGPYKSDQDLGVNLTTYGYDALGRL